MTTIRISLAVAVFTVIAWVVISFDARRDARRNEEQVRQAFDELVPGAWQLDTVRVDDERALFTDASRRAWLYIERHYDPTTGFVRTVPEYPVTTLWDIASGLAALYCAAELDLLPRDEYDRRMTRALQTLREMPIFDGAAFNKAYDAHSAVMVDRAGVTTRVGYGWSATDLGRLLVWLRIIGRHQARFAGDVEAIVDRLDIDRIVGEEYLLGAELTPSGRTRSFQEGRIGYEQYAAEGFALWSYESSSALDYARNADLARVFGYPVLRDRRPHSCLTSEPFILQGLELGWNEHAHRLALSVLAVQRARHETTGQVTIVSEDASHDAPYYFYYYCALFEGVEFAVTAQGQPLLPAAPRTISTKAAFAWYALSPNPYTKLALETVTGALAGAEGWPAGIYEGTSQPSGPENVNTSAVILEAALFARTGRSLFAARTAP